MFSPTVHKSLFGLTLEAPNPGTSHSHCVLFYMLERLQTPQLLLVQLAQHLTTTTTRAHVKQDVGSSDHLGANVSFGSRD